MTVNDRAPARPLVTLTVPLHNEAELFHGLLSTILAQTYPRERLQVLLLDACSGDGAEEMARAAAAYPHIHLIPEAPRPAAAALNVALAQAQGQYIVRLDARTRVRPDYIAGVVARLSEGRWAGVAGRQHAVGFGLAARAHAAALNHPFGTGAPSYRRAVAPVESETLYLGAYPLERLRAVGGWDESFAANEDFDLNTRLREAGGRLLVDPALTCDYLARDGLAALARQYARYGAWRTVTMRRHPRATRLRHVIPALFVAVIVVCLLLAPISLWPLLALLGAYLFTDVLVSLSLSLDLGLRAFPRLLIVFPALHLSWGLAFWWAWLRPPRRFE